nr:AAA family ATPase [Treponema sp.]
MCAIKKQPPPAKNKPLLNAVGDERLVDTFRKILKSFYGVIKGEDAHIRFVFITGATRFDKVSIFSDLNGYLTIKDYEKEFNSYTIGLPNDEVKFGLYKRLLPLYAGFYDDDKKIES